MRRERSNWRRFAAPLIVLGLVAAACGGDDDDAGDTPPTEAPAAEPTATGDQTEAADPEPSGDTAEPTETSASDGTTQEATAEATADAPDAEWEAVVEAAHEEGKVTIYSGQPIDNLLALEAAFEAEYPDIDVEVFRALDNETAAKIQAERDSDTLIADIVVQATLPFMLEKSDEGWFAPVDLPSFDAPGYNRELNVSENGDFFLSSAQIITFAWNTDLWPQGISDWDDLLDPELAGGKIGVLEPSVGANPVSYYVYLIDQQGDEFIDALAAQDPQIYNSALPIGEAIIAGEIAVGAFSLPLIQAKADGAPVDFGFAPTLYGALYNAAVLENAPNPNAARLLANFLISPVGQEAVAAQAASSLPDIPGTVGHTDDVARPDLSRLTPEAVAAFQERFATLFQ